MGFLAVIVAAAGAYAFGAAWYMVNSRAWVVASGIETDERGRPVNGSSPAPYILSAVSMIVAAGMMRHIFVESGIDSLGAGLVGGLGVGAFLVLPWILTNYAYSMRPRMLSIIDGGYVVFGSAIIGAILGVLI